MQDVARTVVPPPRSPGDDRGDDRGGAGAHVRVLAPAPGAAAARQEPSRPAAQPKRPSRQRAAARLTGLDGLRGLAVAAVVAYHVDPSVLPGGFLGVDIFFVLSGCLITRLLLRDLADRGDPRGTWRALLRSFYARRARRLLPALVGLLAGLCVASLVWRDQLASLALGLPAVATYATNWWLIGRHESYFAAAGRPSMLQHLWSLAVEEQFYLVWPLVVLACRRVRWLVLVSLALAAASTAAMWTMAVAGDVPYGDDGSRLYYGTDTHSAGLLVGAAVGALLSTRHVRGWRPPVWLTDALALAAVVTIGSILLQWDEFSPVLYRGGLLVVALLVGGIVVAVVRDGSVAGGLLDAPPLRWLGARSYGIYLWHWPVVVVTRPGIDTTADPRLVDAGRIALTLLLAAASHRFVEAPWRSPAPAPTGELSGGLSRNGAYGVRTAARRAAALRPRVAAGGAAVLVVLTVGATLALDHHATAAVAVVPVGSGPSGPSGRVAPPAPVPDSRAGGLGPVPAATPPTPRSCANPVVRGPSAAYGDSVLLGAEPALARRFPGVAVTAVVGLQARPLLAQVRAAAAAGRLGGTVVLHTGDNGIVSPDDLRQTLAALHAGQHPARRILLLTVRVDRPWQDPNDAILRAAAAHDPTVTLVDWASYGAPHPDWFYDGLHLTPTGATAYAGLVAAAALGCPIPR